MNKDLARIFEWCKLLGMKLNPTKTQNMTVSQSRTPLLLHPDLSIDGTVLSTTDFFKVLGVISDRKLTFEKDMHIIASSVSQKVSILHKCFRMFGDEAIVS